MKTEFLERMKEMLKEEYPKYVETLQIERYRGLRVNTLKLEVEAFQELFPFPLKATPFAPTSFYIDAAMERIGKHPLHVAGACYIQEPSASSAVEVLSPQPGDYVLDLCAAPGGKSTQIAAKLQNQGLLVSNEIDYKRARILLSNMERLGVSEAIITNAHPDELCKQCSGFFDKVLVDAPCSGEGMFKKHTTAMEDWSVEHVLSCANRQLQILHSAYTALKEDGILVYSTCTYAMEENEHVIAQFLHDFPDMQPLDCEVTFGREGFACEGMDATKVRRIFPMDKGEGHFIAKFQKRGKAENHRIKECKDSVLDKRIAMQLDRIVDRTDYHIAVRADKVYMKRNPFLDLGRIRVLREGILCGEIVKNRLEPHQHMFVSAALKKRLHPIVELDTNQLPIFLSGNILPLAGYRGYVAISYQGLILGFGKGDGSVIKNKFPKGLRITL